MSDLFERSDGPHLSSLRTDVRWVQMRSRRISLVTAYVVVDVERTDLERAARPRGMSDASVERHSGRSLLHRSAVRARRDSADTPCVVAMAGG
jgi:hypothetical protein